MFFNSYIFVLIFLPVTIIIYHTLNKYRYYNCAKISLILLSLVFYSYYNFSLLFLITASVTGNFICYKLIREAKKDNTRKFICVLFCILNLIMLFYFKYFNFFIENINYIFAKNILVERIILPLGISFFTFQQLSFIVDIYKNKEINYSFIDYFLYIVFFPQLVAGPIVLHNELIPQINDPKKKSINYDNMYKGIYLLGFGLVKKVIIADNLSKVVNYGLLNIQNLGTINTCILILSYTLQIYIDFSAYSDMATGISKFFNLNLPQNFNSPYKSLSINEFWKRWHMTLTRFFRTYVYIPLGGNKKGTLITYRNMFIVFLLSGIWHGANWTFIWWGILHGIMMIVEKKNYKLFNKIPNYFRWIFTFVFINITFILFRADTISHFLQIIEELFNFTSLKPNLSMIISMYITELILFITPILSLFKIPYAYIQFIVICIFYFIILLVTLKSDNLYNKANKLTPNLVTTLMIILSLSLSILSFSASSEFLYFNF